MLIRMMLVCLLGVTLPVAAAEPFPWLDDLSADDAKPSGKRLIALPEGLHLLERNSSSATQMLVGIHGYASAGYEWVYPLQTLDDKDTATYFFRWDWKLCPDTEAAKLIEAIGTKLRESPKLKTVTLVGHSYGGVLAAAMAEQWAYKTPVEIHVVAAPLARRQGSKQTCNYAVPTNVATPVQLFQWRTRHELDGAFRNLDVDPQIVEINGSAVTLLPETYRGHRLGHNWSISWVADSLKNQ